jgi:methionyl-tRNA synthetase
VPPAGVEEPEEAALRGAALALPGEVAAAVDALSLDEALRAVFGFVDEANRYLNRTAPWSLLRQGRPVRAATVVRAALEALHAIARELEPFLPTTAEALRARLAAPPYEAGDGWNALPEGASLGRAGALFERSREREWSAGAA